MKHLSKLQITNKNILKIFGPPGTGKTKTLLDIVERELQENCTPEDIAFLTFTRKARIEAVTRASKLLKVDAKKFEYFKTLHSIAWKVGGFQPKHKMTPKHWFMFSEVMQNHNVAGNVEIKIDKTLEEQGRDIASNEYISMINKARQKMQDISTYLKTNRSMNGGYLMLQQVADLLKKHKEKHDIYDYTDSIEKIVYEEIDVPQLKVVIIDEAQDLTLLQWALVIKFINSAERVFIAGDDDQEIYDWAGAEALFFKNLIGKSQVLDKSYRVPKNIADKSKKLIERIPVHLREQKHWDSVHDGGKIIYLDNEKFINYNLPGTYYFLATCGYMLYDVTKELRKRGLFYKNGRHLSIKEEVIYAINTWKKLQEGEQVYADSIKNLFEHMKTRNKNNPNGSLKVGAKTFRKLEMDKKYNYNQTRELGLLAEAELKWHEAIDKLENHDLVYIEKVFNNGISVNKEPDIVVNTIYGVKGGEADNVILFSNISPAAQDALRENINELRKVFYTGMTRSKQNLYIVKKEKGYVFKELYA